MGWGNRRQTRLTEKSGQKKRKRTLEIQKKKKDRKLWWKEEISLQISNGENTHERERC